MATIRTRYSVWRDIPHPKMPWATFKRMIAMPQFKGMSIEDRAVASLAIWRTTVEEEK